MTTDEQYMARCLQLAACGNLHAAPNPMVGAVVVHKGVIIGEGYHRKCGEAHAEVNAIASVKNRELLKESTLYVSLEPCSHYGRTPPCAKLIIDCAIPKVIIACFDPFPEVSGRGVRMLQEAGIQVTVGVLEAEALALNRSFITCHTHKRPFIILKWAESQDGYIDRLRTDASEPAARLSSPERMRYNHRMRTMVDAILVGTNTAVLDNPSLSVRHWAGPAPTRICIDKDLRIPLTHHLFDGTQDTMVFTSKESNENKDRTLINIDFSSNIIPQILFQLYERKVNTLLVEGGTQLLNSFLEAGLWDIIEREVTTTQLLSGVKAPSLKNIICSTPNIKKRIFRKSLSIKYYNS